MDSLLALAPAATAQELLNLGSRRAYRNGETLLGEGSPDHHVLLIVNGCVKVHGTTRAGRPTLLAIRVGGDLLGEQAALDGGPRSATAAADGRTVVREIAGPEFLRLLKADPEAGIALSRYLSIKLRRTTRYRVDIGGSPVLTRLAAALCELADGHGRRVPEGVLVDALVGQPELAAIVSTTMPTLERAMKRLRDRGVISTGYRSLIVKDLAALTAIAENPEET
ncbi:Crp/Fnr family transcriptional regulator [Streptomyces sp. CG1]|uniref:Crp/Fnr family transcriptional regulator n=1 Tax=Streptomyces sp. CG1 TaxID=1287523 RepID=UPI0034E1DCBF